MEIPEEERFRILLVIIGYILAPWHYEIGVGYRQLRACDLQILLER